MPMQVTIEGVIDSDVCARGEHHTVEWTPFIRGLVRNRIVSVIEWHHPEPEVVSVKRRPRRKTEATE
ncbi:hypothetical protein [Nocardia cyriacigeorgica]|uniref:hypothetical protein n=1 Tax=Nocardia cyriacigeorgica TaxID=135487 RepID=UPI002455B1DD|nr:hypothetical protein [Nocardia cyriacigeorgica]